MGRNLIISFFMLASLPLAAQNDEVPPTWEARNFFYVSPVDLFLNTLELGYERKLANQNSVAILGGFKLSQKDGYFNRLGGHGEFQYRINLHYKKSNGGIVHQRFSTYGYFAPFALFRYEQIVDAYSSDVSSSLNSTTFVNSGFTGVGFGLRLTGLESRFSMNFFAGGGIKYSDVTGQKSYEDFLQVGYTGITPKISFQMGIAF